jgi:hypothetical protein
MEEFYQRDTENILYDLKKPETFSKFSKNLDRVYQNLTIENIKKKLATKMIVDPYRLFRNNEKNTNKYKMSNMQN